MTAAKRVWVANLHDRMPTYHDWPRGEVQDGEYRTYCGVLVWDRDSDRRMQGIYLRTDHAEKIGRPCRRCFLLESMPVA